MTIVENFYDGGQGVGGDSPESCDTHGSVRLAAVFGEFAFQVVHRVHYLAGVLHQPLPIGRQGDSSPGSFVQLDPQLLFQRPELVADGRLGDMNHLGRTRHAAKLRRPVESAKSLQVHRFPFSQSDSVQVA